MFTVTVDPLSGLSPVTENSEYKLVLNGANHGGVIFIGYKFVKHDLTSISLSYGWKARGNDTVYMICGREALADILYKKPDTLAESASGSAEVMIPRDVESLHIFVDPDGTDTGLDTLELNARW